MTPRYDSMDSSNNANASSTIAMDSNNDLVATNVTDLIRQLDESYAEVSAGIVTAARDAQEAQRNAKVAAELRRRYTNSNITEEDETLVNSIPSSPNAATPFIIPKFPVRPPSPVSRRGPVELSTVRESFDLDDAMDSAAEASYSESPLSIAANLSHNHTTSKFMMMNGSSPKADGLVQAQADEFLQVSLDLERTQEALEREQCAHQETQALAQQMEARLGRLESQIACAQEDLETARESYGRQMDELQASLQSEVERANAAQKDADDAIDLAREKADAEHEMRYYLHQVLERNEEYRECLEATTASPSAHDDKNNHRRALVEAGRQLIKARSTPSPRTAASPQTTSPPPPLTTTKSATIKATALLRESGRRLGMNTDNMDESLDKLARRYSSFAETEIQNLRNEVRQLESYCSLLETGSTIGEAK